MPLSGPLPGELQGLQRAIDELRSTIGSLSRTHGETNVVARLRNDLDRLILDAQDAQHLVAGHAGLATGIGAGYPATEQPIQVSDEPYDPSLWTDADDEGVGGWHGTSR